MPPHLENRGPTLSTMHEIERILRTADLPLSLNEIKRRMSARAVPHRTVRLVIDEFKRYGFVAEGSKGVIWSLQEDPVAWQRSRAERIA